MPDFDVGYFTEPFSSLCRDYPAEDAYPVEHFRVEWGPIFHRGRLDGSARVLVIGQDPAQHEAIVRRILVGEAGERLQGFLAKLGIDRSYTLINTFLYGAYGSNIAKFVDDAPIVQYRNKWISAVLDHEPIEAVISLGDLAGKAWDLWLAAGGKSLPHVKIMHPTRPESASRSQGTKLADEIKRMLENWNAGLAQIAPSIQHPDRSVALVPFGDAFKPDEKGQVPAADLPAGLPAWMRGGTHWADRGLPDPPKKPLDDAAKALQKRATIVVIVPKSVLS